MRKKYTDSFELIFKKILKSIAYLICTLRFDLRNQCLFQTLKKIWISYHKSEKNLKRLPQKKISAVRFLGQLSSQLHYEKKFTKNI